MEKNTEGSVEEKLTAIYDRSLERTYKHRIMEVKVESTTEDLKMYKIVGKLKLSVSEELGDDSDLQERKFSVMTMETDPDMGVAQVFAYLNSIPMEYGDMIFEEGFDELVKGLLEDTDDKADAKKAKTPIQ